MADNPKEPEALSIETNTNKDQEPKRAVSTGNQDAVSEALKMNGNASMILPGTPQYSGYHQDQELKRAVSTGDQDAVSEALKDQELKKAVSKGDKDGVSEALKMVGNASIILPEYGDYRQVSLLQVAAIKGHAHLIHVLQTAGANTDHLTACGFNAMHLAVLFGHMEVIKEFYKSGMDIRTKSSCGLNAIHIATIHGRAHIVTGMVGMNMDIKDKTSKSFNALHLAAQHGQTNMLKVLVNLGMDVKDKTDRGFNALHIATQNGHTHVIRELVKKLGMDIHSTTDIGFNAFHIAAHSGKPQVMDELITLGMNMNSATIFGQKANHLAASNGHPQVLKKLKFLGMDINAVSPVPTSGPPSTVGWNAVHFAVKKGHHRCVEMLAKLGASLDNPDKMDITPLVLAVKDNQIKCMKALKAGGATVSDIDLQDEVFYAIQNGNLDTLKFLIESGLDPNVPDKDGKSPLQLAEGKGDPSIIDWLKNKIEQTSNKLGHQSEHSRAIVASDPQNGMTNPQIDATPHSPTGTGHLEHSGAGNINHTTVILHPQAGATVNLNLVRNESRLDDHQVEQPVDSNESQLED